MPTRELYARGLLEPGNIDLTKRPVVRNPDGTSSTVLSMSRDFGDGREVLFPMVSEEGRVMSPEEAERYYLATGQHLGIFADVPSADAYGSQLHQDYASGRIRALGKSVQQPEKQYPNRRLSVMRGMQSTY